jgi:class 3 adenylate cyclase
VNKLGDGFWRCSARRWRRTTRRTARSRPREMLDANDRVSKATLAAAIGIGIHIGESSPAASAHPGAKKPYVIGDTVNFARGSRRSRNSTRSS